MKITSQLIRAVSTSCALLLTAVVAHIVGCGLFFSYYRLGVESLLIFLLQCALLVKESHELQGPKLAFLALFSQSSVHFVMGGMQMNTLRMLMSHLLGGVCAYWAVVAIDSVGGYSEHNFSRFFLKQYFVVPARLRILLPCLCMQVDEFVSRYVSKIYRLRSPPFLIS